MNLAGAIIYYTGTFLVIVGCMIGGVFLGKTLKERKTGVATTEEKKINIDL